MEAYGFKGRVAVVTGAGRGIGRAYAHLLAERGANVVVNDLGTAMEGGGASADPARDVAAEIVAAGGVAVADTNDVATPEGGKAVIDTALNEFDRVDVVVNNAGIVRLGGLPEADADNLSSHLAVHVMGSFHTTRAAWPHLVEQRYGRIVMTGSTGMFGHPGNLSYATAKAATVGLTRSLAAAGAAHGIKVNVIAPSAVTRMSGSHDKDDLRGIPTAEEMPPESVAPMVAFLAHEECPVTGEIYQAGAGRFARIFIGSTDGYLHQDGQPRVEDVAANWAAINDQTGYHVPVDLPAWMADFLAHLNTVK